MPRPPSKSARRPSRPAAPKRPSRPSAPRPPRPARPPAPRRPSRPSAALPPPSADRLLWRGAAGGLRPVRAASQPPLSLLVGVADAAARLLRNTRCLVRGLPANHALLWGARGVGKSSLVKAVHAAVAAEQTAAGLPPPALVGASPEALPSLPLLLDRLADAPPARRFILFLDDVSFARDDPSYAALKSTLEGGVVDMPDNCLVYATSNRRHLVARSRDETEGGTALRPDEVVQERLSLADRFGLRLGLHPMDEAAFLRAARESARFHRVVAPGEEPGFEREAKVFARRAGGPSGRAAHQFVREWAGGLGRPFAPLAPGDGPPPPKSKSPPKSKRPAPKSKTAPKTKRPAPKSKSKTAPKTAPKTKRPAPKSKPKTAPKTAPKTKRPAPKSKSKTAPKRPAFKPKRPAPKTPARRRP